jgi:hypothetical protein
MARGQRLNGSLTIAYTVDKFGNTSDIVVIGGVDKSGIMIRLGTDEVSKWKYRPHQLNGQPTPFRTAVTLNFPLKDLRSELCITTRGREPSECGSRHRAVNRTLTRTAAQRL